MTSWLRQYCFHVTDIERSIKFYEAIGLTCTSRTQITPEIKEAVVENPERGAWLQLAENSTIEGPIDMGTAFWKLYVYTDDCKGCYEAALANGEFAGTDSAQEIFPAALIRQIAQLRKLKPGISAKR